MENKKLKERFLILICILVGVGALFLMAETSQSNSLEEKLRLLEQKVDLLDQKVLVLEKRALTLDQNISVLEQRSSVFKPPSTLTVKSNWRQLQMGMSKDKVLNVLGEPQKIEADSISERWYYSNRGILGPYVTFDPDSQRVKGWNEP